MKKIFAFACINLWLLTFCVSVQAQEFRTIQEGIEYAEIKRGTEKEPIKVNLLRLDLTKVRLDVIHAMDAAIGLETTSSIASRHGALAAINAGFFRLDKSIFAGDAAGALQIDGKLLSKSSNNRIALGIINGNNKTEINFAHLTAYSLVGFGVDSEVAFSDVNSERKPDEIILYTSHFNRTTLTNSSGTEIILSDCSINNFQKRCNKVEVVEEKGSSVIPPDGFVISIGKAAFEKSNNILYFAKKPAKSRHFEEILRLVDDVKPLESSKQPFFAKTEDIVGGVPQLIKNGKIEITWEQEKSSKAFVETRHPRTAVAKLKDGKFLMVTVDGRQPNVSVGMNLNELAEMLLELGATDAMNLDGGGSTTMFLSGKVVNQPSDKEGERKVSDAILVSPRKKN